MRALILWGSCMAWLACGSAAAIRDGGGYAGCATLCNGVCCAPGSACVAGVCQESIYGEGIPPGTTCSVPSPDAGKSGAEGSPCTAASLDCAPVCCICPAGAYLAYWASECSGGFCARATQACADAFVSNPAMCGITGSTSFSEGDQNAPNCPNSSIAAGKGDAGSRCGDAETNCRPACCECSSGTNSHWASECSNGVCVDAATACADALTPNQVLCP